MECSTTGQAGQAWAGPRSRSHLRGAPGHGHHISTPAAPASASAGDLQRAGSKNVNAPLSSAHGPSSARPGGQGQPQTDPARHFCKPVQPVHLSDLRERWPPGLPRSSFPSVIITC